MDEPIYRTPLSMFTSDSDEIVDQNILSSFHSDGLLDQFAASIEDKPKSDGKSALGTTSGARGRRMIRPTLTVRGFRLIRTRRARFAGDSTRGG